ncbi:NTCP4 protein, partial [Amia calva]|nr:NTCP4 protein [Amia calva]
MNSTHGPPTDLLGRYPAPLLASTVRTTAPGTWVPVPSASLPGSAHLMVAFWDSPLSHGINVFVGIVLCFTMLGLGCTVEVNQLGEHIRRPIGVLLALVSQFVIMPLVAFLLALMFSLDDVAAIAVLLCGCCPGGNLSNILSLLVNGEMNLSIIMTISSTVLALLLMPLCLWIYSRAWINTPVVNLLPFGAIILTLCSTLIPIGLGVFLRYRYNRTADIILKVITALENELKTWVIFACPTWPACVFQVSLWSLLVTLVMLFILTGTMLGPELLASIPASVRSVALETGCQNVQLCTAILKLAFPPQLVGGMYMFPLLYALFQAAEAGIFILGYKMYRKDVLHKQEPLEEEDDDTDITYKKLKEEDAGVDTAYGSVTVHEPNSVMMETRPGPSQV